MTIDVLRGDFIILMIGLFMGGLGACDEQSSTEQVGETVNEGAQSEGEAAVEGAEKAPDAAN